MTRTAFRVGRDPALDIVSYGRRGPGRRDHFSLEQVEQITRTVRRAPEVMVKVSGGSNSVGGVAAHFRYITRRGALELEMDDGERVTGQDAAADLVEGWDLDLDLMADEWDRRTEGRRSKPAKLVHNIVLSMPAGTSPGKLLAASREFAREEFALQHPYAMVLHTDQDHPHVHLVVRAARREGGRLNIKKADLRRYREQFARQLRRQGIEANATPSQVRGRLSHHRRDGVFWAAQRGASRLSAAPARPPSKSLARIIETAEAVQGDWAATVGVLQAQGLPSLAQEAEQFRQTLRIPKTRQERDLAVDARRRHEDLAPQLEMVR